MRTSVGAHVRASANGGSAPSTSPVFALAANGSHKTASASSSASARERRDRRRRRGAPADLDAEDSPTDADADADAETRGPRTSPIHGAVAFAAGGAVPALDLEPGSAAPPSATAPLKPRPSPRSHAAEPPRPARGSSSGKDRHTPQRSPPPAALDNGRGGAGGRRFPGTDRRPHLSFALAEFGVWLRPGSESSRRALGALSDETETHRFWRDCEAVRTFHAKSCPICFDAPPKVATALPCGHVLCGL